MTDLNRNQHYEFWVSYYDELETLLDLKKIIDGKGTSQNEKKSAKEKSQKIIIDKNSALTGHRWTQSDMTIPMQEQALYFKVLYPGLLIGLGNSHDSKGTDGEIQLGFTFDPVTGLPFLPGSTVKGILRSAFLANREYITECLQEIASDLTLSDEQLQELERDIFGNDHLYGSYSKRNQAIGTREDIFFDAYPIKPDNHQHLLGIENITPHLAKKKELEGLTNPNPLTLLKIMPGVVMQFRFRLSDSDLKHDNQKITVRADQKLKLFQIILKDFGAGAKTNVGFGSLQEYIPKTIPEGGFCYLVQEVERTAGSTGNHPGQRSQRPQRTPNHPVQNRAPARPVQQGTVFNATVTKIQSYGAFVRLDNNAGSGMIHISEIANEYVSNIGQFVSLGDRVQVVEIPSNKSGKRAFSMKRVKR